MAPSWLDIGPANSILAKKQDQRLAARVKKIQEILTHLQWRVDIHQQLITLYESDGRYCTTCTQDPTKRYCSLSCPLLRPVDRREWLAVDGNTWIKYAKRDVEGFNALSRDVEAHGSEANNKEVLKWEAKAAGLCNCMQDKSNDRMRPLYTRIKGWTQDWTFEDSWGKGPGLEHDLAPDELD
ncbi:hypothetical protein E8E13_009341 [Curvularia kusanoi]|uniref:Uncharacterized protein n=1 Tax=Curvularia kusanoi TaxID=90978 RepID=A0A9P4TDM2_CURKU|nr:hypothetical protein E8E13_009341 [Curvularia kusanoi]